MDFSFRARFRKISNSKECFQVAHLSKGKIIDPVKDFFGYTQVSEWEQYFPIKDINGNDFCVGDLVNVFFNYGNAEYNHDCIFQVVRGRLGDIQFIFINLLWENKGHNQFPTTTTLSLDYGTLSKKYSKDGNPMLIVPEKYESNNIAGQRWKSLDESNYFEIIGNVHESPELLKKPSDL